MSVHEPSSATWHSALAEKDAAAHARMADFTDRGEVDLLRRRLEATVAELDVARAGVHLRNGLLHDQSVALTERDERIRQLEARLAPDDRDSGATGAARAVVRRGRSVLRRGRSALRGVLAGRRP